MNWALILTTGSFTLIVGIFVSFVLWANWDELTGKTTQSKNDSK